MVSWTPPEEIVQGQFINADYLNARLRDNLIFLKDLDGDASDGTVATYTTTSTSFVNVSSDFDLTFTAQGRPILCMGSFDIGIGSALADYVFFDIQLDSSMLQGGTEGLAGMYVNGAHTPWLHFHFFHVFPVLAAGSHTFKLFWRLATGNTVTLYSKNGPSATRLPQFAVKELT